MRTAYPGCGNAWMSYKRKSLKRKVFEVKIKMNELKVNDVFYYFNENDPDLWSDVPQKRKIRKYTVVGIGTEDIWMSGDTQIIAKYSKKSEPHFLWTSFFGKSCFLELNKATKKLQEAGFELSEVEE